MKKTLTNKRLLYRIVQTSLLQLTLAIVFSSIAMATPVKGQSMLDRKVSVNVSDIALEKVLLQLEKEAQVKFSFNSRALQLDRPVSINATNEPLSSVLTRLLKPLKIKHIQVSNRIVLRKENASTTGLWENEPPTKSLEYQQTESIVTGTVTDENGQGLPGVSVLIKGTQRGTTTDAVGKYKLALSDNNEVLVFSFVGYLSQEIKIGSQTTLNVSLKLDTKALEEVVVVGYGVQRKKDLTGAVSTINSEMFKERKETQVAQALQGAMSGVTVTRNGANGAMGGATIRIRGVTTIGDSNPLVIVDGVPVSDVNQVNPNDIENLSVLKDAASASIYGSRAASGVILITTKRAKTDQASIQYSYENGFDTPTQLPDYMRAQRYMELVNELRWNDAGNGANRFPTFSQDLLTDYNQKHLSDPDRYPDTDWMALTLNKIAPREAHSISVIGGSKFVKSNASVRYEKVGGFYDNKNYNRIFVRSNNDFTINKLIGGTVDFNFKRTNALDPTASDPLYRTRISSPIYPAIWADGRIADGKAGENVYAKVKYGGTDRNTYNQVGGRLALDLKPIEGLKLSGIIAPIFDFNNQKRFNKKVDIYAANDPNQYVVSLIGGGLTTRLDENRTTNYSITTQLLANYLKTIGNHDFTALAGYENYYFKGESMGASRDQYLFDTYPYLNQGPAAFRDNFGTAFETAYRSYFGRLTYSYKDKYLIQANVRRDGSSRFNANYRWGTFPSVSAGWVISEEDFFKRQNLVSFLKLRASWGTLGNERIGNYPSVGIMNFSNALFYQNNLVTAQQTAAQVQYAIQDISWEKTASTDLGLDAYFLKNRLRLTADVYYKETKDMLLALQIPIFVGFENPNQNTGVMTTKGIDLDLGWTDNIGKLRYSASLNLSQFQSVMGDLGGTEFIGDRIKRKGSQFDEWYGYRSEGIYQTQEDVNNSPKLNTNVKVGDMKYTDISGPNGVPDGRISPEYDRVLLGSSQPQWMYGGNFKLDYNGFDLGVTFQGIGYQNTSLLSYTDYNAENWGVFPVYMDGSTWSMNNTADQNLAAKYPRFTETNKGLNRALSDFWLFNGGYFRLKNITLGYTIPQNISRKIMSNNIRFYINATDVFSLNKYPKGWDPEGMGIVSTVLGGFTIGF
ncbi:SusC/RagA family TonB-linked outer membrane protein [Runella aurantiaca]|uniref:SusC/RagA family TonB-linked outer membrane protein n=1 Tax=Runella aurantiaca TaxID=2282308 RepID=A0A369IIH9_9BACT|nr:TonB-dependent receptor [Runella aurantiaca]RDB07975.1 SusC/RagA family TonB-linked outer membrane protein [Runella aurantiaca]